MMEKLNKRIHEEIMSKKWWVFKASDGYTEKNPNYFTDAQAFLDLFEKCQRHDNWYEFKGFCNGTYMECGMTEEEPEQRSEGFFNPTHFTQAVVDSGLFWKGEISHD